MAGSIQLALLQGGPATLIYGIMVSSLAYFSIAGSLSELASVYPTAGGQYHFASILAPRKAKQVISYACGLLAVFSWIAIGAAVTIIPAQQIMALVSLYHTGFETKNWHVFLIYQAMALLVLLYNMFALKWTPWTHYIGCKSSNCLAVLSSLNVNLSTVTLTLSLFTIGFITLLVRATPKAPAEFVWATFINFTGWPDGVCFITGLSTSCFMYIGLDASMHIAEECQNPKKTVPWAMMTAVMIGFCTALAYTIAQLYALTDIDAILTSTE